MEDETLINGVDSSFDPAINGIPNYERGIDGYDEISDLKRKIEALEKEKSGFVSENHDRNEKFKRTMIEIEGLKEEKAEMEGRLLELQREMDRLEGSQKAAEAIAARAAELEMEVSRLQHDLISAESANYQTSSELQQLTDNFEQLNRINEEKDLKIGDLEKEKASLMEEMNKSKTDMGSQIQRLEEEVKERDLELRKLQSEREEMKAAKSSVEEKLKRSSEESEKTFMELKCKNSEMEGKLRDFETKRSEMDGNWCVEKEKCSMFPWTASKTAGAAIASTGTVVAVAAMIYLRYARQVKGRD